MLIRTQIQLTEVQQESLRQLAEQRKCSVSSIIRESVDNLLAGAVMISTKDIRIRAVSVSGKFNSGIQDISENHDRYLAESIQS